MATKKTPRKQKKRFSRRRIILSVFAIAAVIATVYGLVQNAQKQELERKDREKFTVLEADMNKLKTQLDRSAGAGEWTLDKSCSKPGIKFYTGDAGYCRIDVKPLNVDAKASLTDIKSSITNIARIDSEGYDKVAEQNFIGFTFKASENQCGVYFVKNTDLSLTQVDFSCGRPALHMYYPER